MFQVPNVGTVLGRYRLDAHLGSGAMGVVFRAHDTLLDTTVCLKLLNPAAAMNPEIAARFRREALLARRITHPGVCRLFDLHEESGVRFLTMEYIEGKMLRDVIVDEGSLGIGATLKIMEGLAGALAGAWAVGVIHRDLKPRNIMVRPDGSACILDFGIATAGDVDDLTKPGVALGTMHYIAPEVWAGRQASHASDLYALGVIAYNCLTGRMPFRSDDGGLLTAMLQSRAPPPSRFRTGIPPELDALVLDLIALEPTDRPTDAKVVQRRTREIIRAHPDLFDGTAPDDTMGTSDHAAPIKGAFPDAPTSDSRPKPAAPNGAALAPTVRTRPAVVDAQIPTDPNDAASLVGAHGDKTDYTPIPPALSADESTSGAGPETLKERRPPPELAPTVVVPNPLASEETMAPRIAAHDGGVTPETNAAAAFLAGDGASHSILINGVPADGGVKPAAITRAPVVVDARPVPDAPRRQRGALAAVALIVGGLAVTAVIVLAPRADPPPADTTTPGPVVVDPPPPPLPVPAGGEDPRGHADDPADPPPAVVEPSPPAADPAVTHPPPPSPDDAHRPKPARRVERGPDPERARIDQTLNELRALEAKRGLRRGDLPKLDQLWTQLRRDEKRGNASAVVDGAARAAAIIDGARIDKTFVDLKLARFNDRFDRSTNSGAKDRAAPIMTDVLKSVAKGQFELANKRLNEGFKILGD